MNAVILPAKRKVVVSAKKRDKAGRPSAFESKKAVARVLRGEKEVSRFLMLQLVEQGYVEPLKAEKNGKRGRPAIGYQLTSKGRGLVALSKNWFNKEKETVETPEISDADITTAAEYIEGNDNISDDEVQENLADALAAADEMETIRAAEEAEQNTIETVDGNSDMIEDASNENEDEAPSEASEAA